MRVSAVNTCFFSPRGDASKEPEETRRLCRRTTHSSCLLGNSSSDPPDTIRATDGERKKSGSRRTAGARADDGSLGVSRPPRGRYAARLYPCLRNFSILFSLHFFCLKTHRALARVQGYFAKPGRRRVRARGPWLGVGSVPATRASVCCCTTTDFFFVRSQLYRRRFLHPNIHFSAFFEIYILSHRSNFNISQNFDDFSEISQIISVIFLKFAEIWLNLLFFDDNFKDSCWNFSKS